MYLDYIVTYVPDRSNQVRLHTTHHGLDQIGLNAVLLLGLTVVVPQHNSPYTPTDRWCSRQLKICAARVCQRMSGSMTKLSLLYTRVRLQCDVAATFQVDNGVGIGGIHLNSGFSK